jgi:pimeloyl-ACP methyl ester carboxylesterase
MLHTRTIGSGPHTWLALHGWSGSVETFEPLRRLLPADHRMIAVDLPGSGASPSPAAWTRDHLDQALVQTIDAIDTPTLHLLGNCSGAILGLSAARLRPNRFDRVVIIDPFAFVPWYFQLFLTPIAGPVMYYSSFANPVGRWITNTALARHRTRDTDLTTSFDRVNHAAILGTLRVLGEIGVIDSFAGVGRHHRILHGQRTFGAVRQSLPMWQALWPTADVIELKGAGHLPIQETTELLARHTFDGPPSPTGAGQ